MQQVVTSAAAPALSSRDNGSPSYVLDDFKRVARLKKELMESRPAVSLERSALLVEFYENNGFDFDRPLLRQANSLHYVLSNMTPAVFDGELIVGSCAEHRLGNIMYPEFQANIIWPEMVKLPHRRHEPVDVSREALEQFSFRIFPYFKDKNIFEWTRKNLGYPDSLKLMERMIFYLVAHPYGVSHLIPNYRVAIEKGFGKIIDEAGERREGIVGDGDEARGKRDFYRALEIVSEGVMAFAENYSEKCAELAESESNPERKAELEESARILAKVPAEPAETFHEALQSLWLTHAAILQENSDMAMSFGRMDQYLLPYYEADLKAGRLDYRKALELVMCFYIKTNDHVPLVPDAARALFGGTSTNQSITLGGMDMDGGDAVNELSYMFLDALNLLKMREPNVDVRFHSGSPGDWYGKALDVVKNTGAAPALYNDEAVVPALIQKGATERDARDYGVIGCVETTVQGKCYPMTGSILLNLAVILEMALNGGVFPLSGEQAGPKTKKLVECHNFDEFLDSFLKQLNHMVDNSVETERMFEEAHEYLHPIPLMSALIDGPMEAGRDLTSGSARYNSSGVWVVGMPDVVDSLAAVKSLIFDEEKVSAAEMMEAIKANFEGHDKALALCSNKAPKYGNDDPLADELAVNLVEEIDRSFNRHVNYRGGPYHIGYWSITFHSGYGKVTGALPNGRLGRTPLASGATPVSGVARNGPSASLSSTAKLPPHTLANCIANNHKIPLSIMNRPGKMKILEDLTRGYFRKGGMQLQFNIMDKSQLIEAMENPALARDMLVRVSGYCAYFGDLDKAMQLEIINRTEDAI